MVENNLYNRIIRLCEGRGIKGGKLCTDLGISKSTLTDLKMGRAISLSAVTAQKIASYFGVTVAHLLGEEENLTTDISYAQAANKIANIVQNKDFIELFEAYQKLSAKNKQIAKKIVNELID